MFREVGCVAVRRSGEPGGKPGLRDDCEIAGNMQDQVPAEVRVERCRGAVVTGIMVMLRAVPMLVTVCSEFCSSFLVTLAERRRHGDALQRHHEDSHQQKQFPKPGRCHVLMAQFEEIIG